MKTVIKDNLKVEIYETRKEMGAAAAKLAAERIRECLAEKETVNVIFAAAPSQNETLESLINEEGIILDAVKRVDSETSSRRQILPGMLYKLPPKQNKPDLTAVSGLNGCNLDGNVVSTSTDTTADSQRHDHSHGQQKSNELLHLVFLHTKYYVLRNSHSA